MPLDDRRPLDTPRGFAAPARAAAALDAVAAELEAGPWGTVSVPWGQALRFRVGDADLPGNGAPGSLGAIRTIAPAEFSAVDGTAPARHGDTWFAVMEFPRDRSQPVRAEALMGA